MFKKGDKITPKRETNNLKLGEVYIAEKAEDMSIWLVDTHNFNGIRGEDYSLNQPWSDYSFTLIPYLKGIFHD